MADKVSGLPKGIPQGLQGPGPDRGLLANADTGSGRRCLTAAARSPDFTVYRCGHQPPRHQKKEFDRNISMHEKGHRRSADQADDFLLVPQVQIDMKKYNDRSKQKAQQLHAAVFLSSAGRERIKRIHRTSITTMLNNYAK